jgi:hypothetical protein
MSTDKSVREVVEEWNARAKAAGRYLDRDPWSVPPREGSLLDVPDTAESRTRIALLQQQIATLQQEQQPEQGALTEVPGGVPQEVQGLSPAAPTTAEHPSAAGQP